LNVDINLIADVDHRTRRITVVDSSLRGLPDVTESPRFDEQQFWLNIISQITAQQRAIIESKQREEAARRSNELTEQHNLRIAKTLGAITDNEFPPIPNALWEWWDKYNETEYQRGKTLRRGYQASSYVARYRNPEYVTHRTAPRERGPALPVRVTGGFLTSVSSPRLPECLVAGTKISTLRGLQPIESIRPGDLVLARNVATGELSYAPVISRTTRPPTETVRLTVNDEVIQASLGHLLWVSGKGWTKAGDIKQADLLHAAAEPAVVMDVKPGAKLPTYNLIVADHHSYFVGSSRVLSHDVLPRGSVHERVPGEFMFSTTNP
jgi:hypothetical protein